MAMQTFSPFSDPFFNTPGADTMMDLYASPIPYENIATTFPRHVASRTIQTMDGRVLWRPAADVFETTKDIVVHVDLPGVPKNEINIDVDANAMTISGHHRGREFEGFESASSRVRERGIGDFRKIVRLPAGVDLDLISTSYRDGLLEIRIPKTTGFTGRKITVE